VGFEAAKSQPDIDHNILEDEGIDAGQRRRLSV
jgi:hypothetical protein